jgi:hypothetical protein
MDVEDLSAVQQRQEVDLDSLIRELDAGWDRLPEEALRTCQRHRELVTPRLVEVLQEAGRLGREGIAREGSATTYALYLLTEFRAKEALPAVFEIFSLRDPVLDDLIGESVTEFTRRVLTVLADDQPDLIESLIPSPHLNEYIRWEAAGALCQLVKEGRLTRNDALARLVRQMRAAVQAEDAWAATITVSELGNLNPLELQDEIKAVFDQCWVDESMMDWECFKKHDLHPDQPGSCPGLLRREPAAVEDTVAEIRGWYCFSERARRDRERWEEREAEKEFARTLGALAGPHFDSDPNEPPGDVLRVIRRDTPRVGRNDPCPCGSGKKYKKCCLIDSPS